MNTRIVAAALSLLTAGWLTGGEPPKSTTAPTTAATTATAVANQPPSSDSADDHAGCCREGGAGQHGKAMCRRGPGHRNGSNPDAAPRHQGMNGRGRAAHGGGQGPGQRGQHPGMGRGMMGAGADHETIHSLMADHQKIQRKVVEIPKGVRTETTSSDPAVAGRIRQHAHQMKARVESGTPIRMFDPLFREIFANAEEIEMQIEEIAGGVRVIETSENANVVKLIRQHAKVVSEFTAEGMARMHEPSPLPEGY